MAIRFDANADRLTTAANVPNYNSTYTVMGWFYITTDQNDESVFFYVGANSTNYDGIGTAADGTTMTLFTERTASGFASTSGTNLSTATWYHVAVVRSSATSFVLYLNGVSDISHTTNVGTGATAADVFDIGNSTDFTNDNLNGRVAAVKQWNTALTVEQIQQEMRQYLPVITSGLVKFTPLLSSAELVDFSSTLSNWSSAGTLTTEDGPPIPWKMGRQRIVHIQAAAASTYHGYYGSGGFF